MNVSEILKKIPLPKRATVNGLSFLSLNNVVASVAGFLSVVVLANLLSQTDYGVYKYIFSVGGILSALSLTGGYRNAVIQSVAKGYDGIVAYLFKINPLLNLPMILGAAVISTYYFVHDNFTLALGVPIVAIGYIFTNNTSISISYLNGRKEYRALFIFQTILSFASTCALVISALITQKIFLIILFNVIASGIISTISYFYIHKKKVRNNTFDHKVFNYGKHLSLMNIGSTVLMNIDSVVIFTYIGSHDLALYALATPFIDRIIGFFKASYFFALPKFTEMGPERAVQLLYKRSFFAFLFGLCIVGAYYLIAPYFFALFFPKYLASVPFSRLFALSIPLVALSTLPTAYIDSLVEIKKKYILYATNFVTRIITLFIFVQVWGVPGVIISELVSRIITTIVMYVLIEQYRRNNHQ